MKTIYILSLLNPSQGFRSCRLSEFFSERFAEYRRVWMAGHLSIKEAIIRCLERFMS